MFQRSCAGCCPKTTCSKGQSQILSALIRREHPFFGGWVLFNPDPVVNRHLPLQKTYSKQLKSIQHLVSLCATNVNDMQTHALPRQTLLGQSGWRRGCLITLGSAWGRGSAWALPGDVARSGSQVSSAQSRHSLYCSEGWSREKVAYVGLSVNPNHSLSPSLVSHRAILKEASSPQTPRPALRAPHILNLLPDPGGPHSLLASGTSGMGHPFSHPDLLTELTPALFLDSFP